MFLRTLRKIIRHDADKTRPYPLTVLVICSLATPAWSQDRPLFRDPEAPVEQRVHDLLGRLTPEEKANLCSGSFVSGGVPRLGVPKLFMLDGRQGLRPVDKAPQVNTTLLPCALALSCAWDEQAPAEFGGVLAEEMLALGQHVLLAPMMNLVRSPLGGRNFENLGEDPFLAGTIAAAYVRGVQAHRVGACSCLLVANDCESRRHFTSSNMDLRTLREVHLLPYEMSIRQGGVWTMMSANSLLNGVYCAQNRLLIQEIVKDEIGFDGVMITDWRAAYDTVPAALAGTDMTTGLCGYVFGQGNLLAAVRAGNVPMVLLDEKARRVLRLYIRSGVLDPESRHPGELDSPAHRAAARKLSAETMVLLRNGAGVLPLDPARIGSVLVTGPAANQVLQGGGSGRVPAAVRVTPLEGLREALGEAVRITHVPWGPLAHAPGEGAAQGAAAAENASRTLPAPARAAKAAKRGPAAAKAAPAQPLHLAALTAAARDSGAVLFVAAGQAGSEGMDLKDMSLPEDQGEVIDALAKVNPRVIVVIVGNGAVRLEPWEGRVPAILAIHYAGQATSQGLADVLTGKVNPGAKLSYTFARRLEDYPCHALKEWPARLILDKDPGSPGIRPEERRATHAFDTEYAEGVFVGYRWFDQKGIEPLFPFGFGLSYTTFALAEGRVDVQHPSVRDPAARVSISVTNTGRRRGSEVVQVYVQDVQASAPRPPRELKGFQKVTLDPGQSQRVTIPLDFRSFAFWSPEKKGWVVEPGTFRIAIGTSSRAIAQEAEMELR